VELAVFTDGVARWLGSGKYRDWFGTPNWCGHIATHFYEVKPAIPPEFAKGKPDGN
jgi:hypothetical protein